MKVALVALCHNHLDITKKFLDSIISELDSNYDLYILDNGSTDETYKYICDTSKSILHDDTKVRIYASRSETNLGFAGGNNYLIDRLLKNNEELAKLNHDAENFYSNVILINNDTLITKKAIEKLVEINNADNSIGATGPLSNMVAGAQKVQVQGLTETNYKEYADNLANTTKVNIVNTFLLIGFCLCIRIDVLKKVGLLDTQFGLGMWEDNDYCLRIKKAGYKLFIVKESYIYHYGSQTIKDFNMQQLFEEGKKKFIKKHKNFKLSVSMIVKNEERYLPECLNSIKDFVDEIVITDTGSVDKSKEICSQYTDKIYDRQWDDSFANARNNSLSKCTGDWIISLDADEVIPTGTFLYIYDLILTGNGDAYIFPIRNLMPNGSYSISTTTRLFKNKPFIRFKGRVHETVDRSLVDNNLTLINATQPFIHYGYLKGKVKTPFYRDLCMKALKDDPTNFETYYNLGKIFIHDDKDYEKAVEYLSKSIELGGNHYLIHHELGVAKYLLFLSKHQDELKDIYDCYLKCEKLIPQSFPEYLKTLKSNKATIERMILDKEEKK